MATHFGVFTAGTVQPSAVYRTYRDLGWIFLSDFDPLCSSLGQIGNLALVSVRYMQRHAVHMLSPGANELSSALVVMHEPGQVSNMQLFRIIG